MTSTECQRSVTSSTGAELLRLALLALEDADAGQVFADAVLESEWFDDRVMPLRWPIAKPPPRGLNRQQREARKRAAAAQANVLHTRAAFDAEAARANETWCRACAAVLLFGGWRKGRFTIIAAMHRKRREEEQRFWESVRINGRSWRQEADGTWVLETVETGSVQSISVEPRFVLGVDPAVEGSETTVLQVGHRSGKTFAMARAVVAARQRGETVTIVGPNARSFDEAIRAAEEELSVAIMGRDLGAMDPTHT